MLAYCASKFALYSAWSFNQEFQSNPSPAFVLSARNAAVYLSLKKFWLLSNVTQYSLFQELFSFTDELEVQDSETLRLYPGLA